MNKNSLEISMPSQGARDALRLHWHGGTAATTVSNGYQSEPVVLEDPFARLEIWKSVLPPPLPSGGEHQLNGFARRVRDSTSFFWLVRCGGRHL